MLSKQLFHQYAFSQMKRGFVKPIRTFVSTPKFQFQEKDELHKGDHYCKVPDRSLIELEGQDTSKFLQGLITNHMPKISPGGDGFYTAFLTPSGRMLHDTFIYPVNVGVNFPHPKFMIDCPTSTKDHLVRHLRRYILRSKVKLRDCSDEYQLYHIWGHTTSSSPLLVKKENRLSDIGCFDPRIPGFGYRAVVQANQDVTSILPPSGQFEELDSTEYTIRRLLHGLPENADDIWPEVSLPLECNFDYMNGVDFRKGCYVGQELTIRTFHTGVVRKRLVPIQFYDNNGSVPEVQKVNRQVDYPNAILKPQTDIKLVDGSSKRGVGKLGSGIHNIGLALMRLEHVQKFIDGEAVEFGVPAQENLRIRPFLPDWWSEDEKFNQHQ